MLKVCGGRTLSSKAMRVTFSLGANCEKWPVKEVSAPARPSIADLSRRIRSPCIEPETSSTYTVLAAGRSSVWYWSSS